MLATLRRQPASSGYRPRTHDHRWVIYAVLSLLLLIGSLLAREFTWRSPPELLPLLDMAAALLALTAGTMALIRHYSEPDAMLLLVGTGLLGTAFLGGYRAVIA